MSNIFLIHGSYGNPKNHWFPWLQTELEKLGHTVYTPKFPTPIGQKLKKWLKTFDEYRQYIDQNTIMIGHSLGVPFILNVLETLNHPIKASIFIAGFFGKLNHPIYDPLVKTFSNKDFNWEKIKQNCQNFTVFHSDNDPIVPLTKGQELAEHLGIAVDIIPNAGHFSSDAKWFEFPQLLEKI